MFNYGSMYMGGAERVISSLANDFVKRGDQVSIMVTDSLPSGYPLDERVRFINQNAEASSASLIDAIQHNMHRVELTRKYLREIRPDVVVCFGVNNLTFVVLSRFFLSIKTIGSERSNPYHSEEGRFWKKMKQIVSPVADGYIFSTAGAKKYYPQQTQRKSAVIPNGIFADTIPEAVLPLNQRNRNKICAVGRLHPVKGFDILIRAFAIFHRYFPDYTLHIYGEGEERTSLGNLISQLNVKNSVMLEGHVADIPQKLCENNMFVLSSHHEGMPNALIEAMACGLPCVATRCDFGPTELITDEENGLLVPVGNAEIMAKAMERIASDSAFAEKLSRNAIKICETHSMEIVANQFYDYIVSVAKK
jgi:Glycosyltransferase